MALVPTNPVERQLNYFDDIFAGSTDWKVRVRIIRLWTMVDPKTKKNPGSIDMILVDEKATVPPQWLTKFIDLLKEGESYVLENICVGKNAGLYPKTCHQYKLNFIGATNVTPTILNQIPVHVFDFMDFPNIINTKISDIFIDVIGHVVEKNNMKTKDVNGRRTSLLEVVMEDLTQNRIKCALWGDFAEEMQYVFETSTPGTVVIVVLQLCRLNDYKGVGSISTGWNGTRLYINEDIAAINDYRSRLNIEEGSLTPAITQMSGNNHMSITDELLQTPKMNISDLMEATQPCVGCVLVDAVEFDMSEGWAFNSCNTCYRSARKVGTGFSCDHCDKLVSATPRYKLNVVVIDDTGSTTLTLFNGLVSLIVGRSAVDLINSYSQRGTLSENPAEFEPLLGKKFLFKVDVSKGNIEKGYQTYTARKFSQDPTVIQRFIQKHGLNVCSQQEEAEITKTLHNLSTPVIDLGDSTDTEHTDDLLAEFEITPTSKQLGKRPMGAVDAIDFNAMDYSPESVKKPTKATVKLERKE